jgi:hypothetical protein
MPERFALTIWHTRNLNCSGARCPRILFVFSLRRLSYHQFRFEQDALRRDGRACFDQLQRQLAGLLSNRGGLLVDAAERNFEKFIVDKISAAHDRYVFWNAQPRFKYRRNRSVCNRVVVTENSIGWRRLLQELIRRFVAGRVAALFRL